MAPHVPASFPVHMQTRIASLDTSLLNTPFHPPPTPASSIPSVAKPVPYKWQESAPRQQGELLNVPDAFYVDPEVELLRQGLRTSPLRPRAPIAHMSPTLGDVPMGPGATNQKYQTRIQDAEDSEEEVSSDNKSCALENMSDCSSGTSETLTNEWEDDAMDNNSSDGVINLQPSADRNDYHEADAYGVDVDNSLHINGRTGNFHLGLQWQAPETNAARSNAGPEFGRASIWGEDHWGHGPAEWDGTDGEGFFYVELAGGRSHSHGHDPIRMAVPSEPSVHTSTQEVLAARMCGMHLEDLNRAYELSQGQHHSIMIPSPQSYQDHREHQAPAPAYNGFNNATHSRETAINNNNDDDRVIRQDPIPVDLSMSGACRPGPSHNYRMTNWDF
ncbi:hypothetical protein F4824DRAFT_494901 [Ustulina deusta]|nr:hypothetical protein F4824DRAFT_494901 [Ustulina deusta]